MNNIKRIWYLVDAKNKVLGRLSSVVVKYLIGKHKSEYAPYNDVGDYIVIINAQEIFISGRKRENKIYYRHTGYVGGIKQSTFKHMMKIHPSRVLEIAIKGMLPKNSLGRIMFRRLKVYPGLLHKHMAQLPQLLSIL